MVFCVWVLSLSIAFSSSIWAARGTHISFLYTAVSRSTGRMDHILFARVSEGRCLGRSSLWLSESRCCEHPGTRVYMDTCVYVDTCLPLSWVHTKERNRWGRGHPCPSRLGDLPDGFPNLHASSLLP